MLIITPKNQLYPTQLQRLHSVPSTLYIQSNEWEKILTMPMLAVVGTRRPSTYGAGICAQLVRELASRGVCIVSGLALGTDSIAHKAALEVGGTTIAVLPSGIEHIYPASHTQLATQIVSQGGALISEYPPKADIAHKSNFIARNRIIAGLSSAVLIPEAAAKSGSLHTARFALESGIDVLAVPGLITNPEASGCHNLIKSGAQLVTEASDVLNTLKISSKPHAVADIEANTPEEHILLTLLQEGIQDGDELQVKSKLTVEKYNQTLTMLEITGRVAPLGGNTWRLT